MQTRCLLTAPLLLCLLAPAACQSSRSFDVEGLTPFEQEIIRDLDSRDTSKRIEAASRVALFKIGAAAPSLTKMLANDRTFPCGNDLMNHPLTCSEADAAAGALAVLGAASVQPLISVTRHPRPSVRARAIEILAGIGDPRANDAMLEALNDRDANVRLSAMAWRAPSNERMMQSRIDLLLHDPNERVRANAAAQLTEFQSDRKVVNAFQLASKDPSSEVRDAVETAKKK
jgi:HEAT repeat protein